MVGGLALCVVGCGGPARTRPSAAVSSASALVADPPLQLVAQAPADEGGTMHALDALSIALLGARPLVVRTDYEAGELVPIVGRQVALGGGRYVLLGWSSTGAGMETLHAWLIARAGDSLAIVDRLEATRDRRSSAFVVSDAGGALRIGVPLPGEEIHAPEDWQLRFGRRALDIAGWRALPAASLAARFARDHAYAPPLGPEGSFAAGPVRVAWFAVEGHAFVEAHDPGAT